MTLKKSISLLTFISIVFVTLGCAVSSKNSFESKYQATTSTQNATEIDGVYTFVSDIMEIKDTQTRNEIKTQNEWSGLWIFSNGHFSQNLTRIERQQWTPSHFPTSPQELGFDSVAGRYSLKAGRVILEISQSLYPGRANAIDAFSYTLEGQLLTLSQETYPTREYSGYTRRVLKLRKI